jgi:hypothetical protein
VAVLDSAGKLAMEAVLETKTEAILQFSRGLRGSLHVTFEEGTCAAWLHGLLKPHVSHQPAPVEVPVRVLYRQRSTNCLLP